MTKVAQTDLQLTGGSGKTKRRELDFYPTPANCTHALMLFLLEYHPGEFYKSLKIWEPACGSGSISNVIKSYGFEVYSSDIFDYGYGDSNCNFLTTPIARKFDAIITNPPFDLSSEFISQALKHAKIVCMLLKSQYWHAKSRVNLFNSCKPSYILPLTWRPDFYEHLRVVGDKTPAPTMEVAWTVWINGEGCAKYIPLLKPEFISQPKMF
jgi:hypothetical protein